MTATYTAGFEHRTAYVKFMYNETAEVPQFVYEEEEPTNAFVSDQDQRGFKFVSVSSNGIMIVTFCWSSLSMSIMYPLVNYIQFSSYQHFHVVTNGPGVKVIDGGHSKSNTSGPYPIQRDACTGWSGDESVLSKAGLLKISAQAYKLPLKTSCVFQL